MSHMKTFHKGGGGHRTHRSQWEHVAKRKAKENWSVRKIAKFLGKSVAEIKEVLG